MKISNFMIGIALFAAASVGFAQVSQLTVTCRVTDHLLSIAGLNENPCLQDSFAGNPNFVSQQTSPLKLTDQKGKGASVNKTPIGLTPTALEKGITTSDSCGTFSCVVFKELQCRPTTNITASQLKSGKDLTITMDGQKAFESFKAGGDPSVGCTCSVK